MNAKYVIIGVVIIGIGLIGINVMMSNPEDPPIRKTFSHPWWFAVVLTGIPILIRGCVKKIHIVFVILSSIGLVITWIKIFEIFLAS